MGWSFRRRIKVIPGVHLNLSKRGISTTIGIPGASLTFASGGTYANVGIPGSGVYSRKKILGSSSFGNPAPTFDPSSNHSQQAPDYEYVSADPLEISSDGLRGFQVAVHEANKQRLILQNDLRRIRASLIISKALDLLSKVTLFYFIVPAIKKWVCERINSQSQAISQICRAINESAVPLEVDMDSSANAAYQTFLQDFRVVCSSHCIWDITSASNIDRVKTRSAAALAITRQRTEFCTNSAPGISSLHPSACLKNLNGADIYIYPGFFVMFQSPIQLGIVELSNLRVSFSRTQFVEQEALPTDSRRVGEVWERANKDGSRDKRYADNRQLPLMEYGEITFESESGIYEKYMISNCRAAEKLVISLQSFIEELTS